MYNINVDGHNANAWFTHHGPQKKKEWKPPSKCTFCSKKIEEGDYFNVGYDEHRIYAETCDHIYCKQWLKWKVRRRK